MPAYACNILQFGRQLHEYPSAKLGMLIISFPWSLNELSALCTCNITQAASGYIKFSLPVFRILVCLQMSEEAVLVHIFYEHI